jgi:hypothetical protein
VSMDIYRFMRRAGIFIVLIAQAFDSFGSGACRGNTQNELAGDLVLRTAWLRADRQWVGRFELSNVATSAKIVLQGTRERGGFFVDYPTVILETRDAKLQWEHDLRDVVAGSFISPHKWTLNSGAKVTFVGFLMSEENVPHEQQVFRILLRTVRPDACIVSRPFHSIVSGGEVTGFETSE